MGVYLGRNGTKYLLTKRIGRGGEGEVFEVDGMPRLVAKLYFDSKLSAPAQGFGSMRDYLGSKIECMLAQPINGYLSDKQGNAVLTVAWPADSLKNERGEFVGYVMPKTSSKHTIHVAYRPIERPLLFSRYTWRNAVAIAYNLALSVSYLHGKGIVIGDFNSNNIKIDAHGFVTLIDADSFSISDARTGAEYKCMVGVPEVLAPELQGKRLSSPSSRFTKESDCFSLAVHVFHALTDGVHPFGCANLGLSKPSSSVNPTAVHIASGACPYVSSSKLQGLPSAPDMGMFPKEIRDLFDRCFTYTARTAITRATIERRPTAEEWRGALYRLYQGDFVTCSANPQHVYLKAYGRCPWCATQTRPRLPNATAARHTGTPPKAGSASQAVQASSLAASKVAPAAAGTSAAGAPAGPSKAPVNVLGAITPLQVPAKARRRNAVDLFFLNVLVGIASVPVLANACEQVQGSWEVDITPDELKTLLGFIAMAVGCLNALLWLRPYRKTRYPVGYILTCALVPSVTYLAYGLLCSTPPEFIRAIRDIVMT